MGDCRLQISVARDLLEAGEDDDPSPSYYTETRMFLADTTVVEVVEAVLRPLPWKNQDTVAASFFPKNTSLWDCTLHPPKDITDWPLKQFPNKTGPQSKTLYDAGWFPSGTLQLLPSGTSPRVASAETYDDAQYNLAQLSATTSSSSGVLLVDQKAGAMPSDVFDAVKARFDGEVDVSAREALQVRKQRRVERLKKEAERNQKIEHRIRKLEEKSSKSNKKTSELVRNMLIKSRCTGAKHLDVRDRVYLHTVVVSEIDTTQVEQYRYFSQQDTVGKIITEFKTGGNDDAELLIRTGESEYRRLPTTMRLYEAMAHSYLKEVDSIVIRCYNSDTEEATSCVLNDQKTEMQEALEGSSNVSQTMDDTEENIAKATTEEAPNEGVIQDEQLHVALKSMDDAEASKSKGKKKKSKTSGAVRTMLIKGRAKGDAKRVPRMEDRFFMELVVAIEETSGELVPKMSYVFFSKTDSVGRLLRDCVPESKEESIVLVPTVIGDFRKLSLDLTWKEAEAKGILKPFERVIVLIKKL